MSALSQKIFSGKKSPSANDGDFFGRPTPTTKTIGLHPRSRSAIRADRETVRYLMLLRRLVLRRLVQQQQNCHNHMLSISRGHPAAGAKVTIEVER
jgi:hypothetical protein